MELPHLGKHCNEKTCNQLDFLPMKCDACSQIFCKDHLQYDDHSCSSSYKKNIQVPVCPLCNQPIPVPRGSVPDAIVSDHIENNCQVKVKEKVFTNRCNKAKCKKKEMVPLVCDTCKLNFCLTHRHPADHACSGPAAASSRHAAAAEARSAAATSSSGQSRITNFFSGPFRQAAAAAGGSSRQLTAGAAAAINRQEGRGSTPGRPLVARAANGGMSEDEALAAALAASMTADTTAAGQQQLGGGAAMTAEEEDRMLALALAESERLSSAGQSSGQAGQTAGNGEKSCNLQ